ncbi:MAG TPA: hypothetical protein PK205_17325 [Promineifilum sp.]|nr:hypothetical protein [Promineifilum sp.]
MAAYEWGRRNDRAFYTGAWAPEEHLVRATEGCEFRGLMVRQGLFGVPRKFGKYPPAVVIARQRGSRIERVFAPLPAEFLESAHLGATLAQIDIRPAEWFAAWSRKIGGRELILADEVEIGGLQ